MHPSVHLATPKFRTLPELVACCCSSSAAVPDSMPIAWYSRGGLNQSSLISATSQGIHASTSVGATLDQLSRKDCGRVVFNSSFMLTPESYANHQWLQSVRLLANGSAYGLVHNEFSASVPCSLQCCCCCCPR